MFIFLMIKKKTPMDEQTKAVKLVKIIRKTELKCLGLFAQLVNQCILLKLLCLLCNIYHCLCYVHVHANNWPSLGSGLHKTPTGPTGTQ